MTPVLSEAEGSQSPRKDRGDCIAVLEITTGTKYFRVCPFEPLEGVRNPQGVSIKGAGLWRRGFFCFAEGGLRESRNKDFSLRSK